jgi:hypothetical protein
MDLYSSKLLNLQENFNIILAGVLAEQKIDFFPGTTLYLQSSCLGNALFASCVFVGFCYLSDS